MKNNIFKFIIILFCFFYNNLLAEDFTIESSEINILKKGNIIHAKNGVNIFSNDGIEITTDEVIYDKKKLTLKLYGNVKIKDKVNDFLAEGNEYTYYKKDEKIISSGISHSKIKNKFFIKSNDLVYERKLSEVHSNKKTKIEDTNNNIFFAENFKINLINNYLKVKNLSFYDNSNNQYFLDFALIDLNNNKFLGSDIFIDFEDTLFGNNENNPRLKGNSVISENDETIVYKGTFTTCNQKEDKCPPWSIYAEKVTHKKTKKQIEYKNAWLKLYDKPVLYFPRFFHPDPTVKRQSGFLMPTFQNSNNSGTSIQIPYYKVISENKDLTFSPRLFFDDEILIQNEFRQANKNSNLVIDLGINKDGKNTKNHFFVDLKSLKQNKNLDFHLETVSNDTYLKKKNIFSSILEDSSSLHSYINYNSFDFNSSFEMSFEVFEDLSKKKSNRYEYIFPNFDYEKILNSNSNFSGDLTYNFRGFNKNYDTNTDETILVNDFKYFSSPKINSTIEGLQTSYKMLLRNINSNSDNSSNFKNGDDQKLLSSILLETSLPLKREMIESNSFLTPRISARYSPNATKNNFNSDIELDYENIFSLDRVDNNAVEGGESLTFGLEYSFLNNNNENILDLSIANIVRFNKNLDLPKIHNLSEKRSNYIGNLKYAPSKFFDLNYQFSLDKNFEESNYDLIKANFNMNNFITSFEFLEEDNHLDEISYLKNTTTFNLSDSKSLSFGTSKNLDQNITDYYNLIYEYENDCLTAAIEYNKSYYTDADLKPEESIMFSIKIIPFGKIYSPAAYK